MPPKRSLRGAGRPDRPSKERRTNEPVPPYWSEQSDHEAGNETIVLVPPPKTRVKTNRELIFPMSRDHLPLPQCDGPKLEPFSRNNVGVRFIKELGDNAVHSNVFEVVIQGKHYALKLFRTCSTRRFPENSCWPSDARPKRRDMIPYFRAFYQECRAYGRIQERRIANRYWKCHGYLRLPPQLRNELCDITGLPEHYWQMRPPEFGRWDKPTLTVPQELKWPIYGIVKELAPYPCKEIDVSQRNIKVMLADLRQLHKNGVVNNDIADRNYLAGRIIDFSMAYTLPHMWYERPESCYRAATFEDDANDDMWKLRDMIIESGVKTTAVQAGASNEDCVAFRTRSRHVRRAEFNERPPSPLYELGVNEPQPERPYSPDTVSVVPTPESQKGMFRLKPVKGAPSPKPLTPVTGDSWSW